MNTKLIVIFLVLIEPFTLKSQNFKIIARAESNKGIYIQWIPSTDTIWSELHSYGFKVTRTSLNSSKVDILADHIKPKEFSWFWERRSVENGFPLLLGRILYDPIKTTQLYDYNLNNIRYSYLFDEAFRNPDVAVDIGYGILDNQVKTNESYRYQIFSKKVAQELLIGEIEIQFSDTIPIAKPENIDLEFSLPNGLSLSSLVNDNIESLSIKAIAKPYEDSIVLRWIPINPDFWAESNKEGYLIFRNEVDEMNNLGKWTLITSDTLRPWSRQQFSAQNFLKDSLLFVASQCLYGDLQADRTEQNYARYQENQMRFMTSSFVAERSVLAAEALCLRYVDRNVDKNSRYVYKVQSLASINPIQDAWIEVMNLREQDLSVVDGGTDSLEHAVLLKWSKSNTKFSAFQIERSSNGGNTFELLTESPLIFLESDGVEVDSPWYQYLDSVPENYRPYIYRIRGLNTFSEWSAALEVVGMGVDRTSPDIPEITILETKDGGVDIRWTTNPADQDIKYFHLWKGYKLDETFTLIVSDIPSNVFNYFYSAPLSLDSSYYFAIQAEDMYGNISSFSPYNLPVIDSIPPTSPTNILWEVDSTGIVTLAWDQNTESDLGGYRVFAANDPNHEFSEITREAILVNLWIDTITLDVLDKEIYYRIAAEDIRYNLSPLSEVIVVKRPDIVPPAAPAALPASFTDTGILLSWNPSSSNDVKGYHIYRKEHLSPEVVAIDFFLNTPLAESYIDTSAQMDILYEYTIVTEDDAGLLSEPSFPILARRPFDSDQLRIENFKIRRDTSGKKLVFTWDFSAPDKILRSGGFSFNLYESTGVSDWRKIKQVPAGINEFIYEKTVAINQKVVFAIKAVLIDGKTSALVEYEIPN